MKLLDTDVCVELLRGNRRVIEHRRQTSEEVVTSWVTVGELFYGAAKSEAPDANRRLLAELFAGLPAVGLDAASAALFGSLKAHLEQQGQRLADADLLIAAVAINHGATLVTGNRKHFGRIAGLELEDWVRGSPD